MHGRTPRPRGTADLRRRGRSAVVMLLLTWAVTQFALGRAADRSPWLRDPMYADKEVKYLRRVAERTTAAGPPFTVAFVGSSRTMNGVRGMVVEDALERWIGRSAAVVNFGMPASGPVTNLITARRLLALDVRPDLVVIEVLPPLLAGQLPSPMEHHFLLPERLDGAEIDLVLDHGFPADETRRTWWTAELVPVYGDRFPLLGRLVGTWLPWNLRFSASRDSDPTGWLRPIADTVTVEQKRHGIQHARDEYFELLQHLTLDGPAARAVGETLEECRRQGVRAALLLMPEGTEFRSWYPPAVEASVYAFLDRLSQEYGVPTIDARRWLTDDCFSDSHHLLPAGAAALSDRLAQVIGPLARPERFVRGR